MDSMKGFLHKLLDYTLVAMTTLAVVGLFLLLPMSFSRFNISQSLREQYDLIDVYTTIHNQIGRKHQMLKSSAEIIIVNTGGIHSRQELADIIAEVDAASPEVIGLDIMFLQDSHDSAAARLSSIIRSSTRIISPATLEDETGDYTNIFNSISCPFYASPEDNNLGFINIELMGKSETCRTFTAWMYHNERKVGSMPLMMVKTADPERYAEIKDNKRKYINYKRSAITTVDAASLEGNTDLLKDRIVLIGDITEISDQHSSPLSYRTSGVEILAHTVSTILNDSHIRKMNEFGAWLIAFLVCLAFVPLINWLRRNEWVAIFIPMIQTLLILLFIFFNYLIFANCNYYIQILYIMLAIGFSDLGNSLYFKVKGLILKKIRHE